MSMLIANQMVSPVLVAKRVADGTYSVSGTVLGTCFSVRDGFCLTAGHVVRELGAAPLDVTPLIAMPLKDMWGTAQITESEVLDADIGLIKYTLPKAANQDLPALPWNLKNLPVLATVRTVGFPFGGIDTADDERSIIARAFKGEVVCTLPRYRPPGFAGPLFSVHELSFQALCGLSGAPLLTNTDPTMVKGVVIGNKDTEVPVWSQTETECDGRSSHTTERVERLSFGVAVRAVDIASLCSSLLGTTIGDHLKKNGLLE